MWTPKIQESKTSGYIEYHKSVVEACVKLMGEEHREFFDKVCSYEEQFTEEGGPRSPDEVAQDQADCIDWE